MKSLKYIFTIFSAISIVSCSKFLDINQNPNKATTENPPKPENILPQALVYTASNVSAFNSYGAQLGGYAANAGGYGGFGSSVTYQFSTGDFSSLWSGSYDNLEDYQSVITQTRGVTTYNYYNAVAMIMKAYSMQMLVDAYNNVPYTDALEGANTLTPKYEAGTDIYNKLALTLDTAIDLINTAKSPIALSSADVIFGGNVTKWKKFANTLKLRLILRGGSKVSFTNTTFSSDGFLDEDAVVNPGYSKDNGKQNPLWNSWAYTYTGGTASAAWIPTKFILAFYNGTKITDSIRGKASYYQFPKTVSNQLGDASSSVPKSPTGTAWYSGINRSGSTAGNSIGILKGPNAGLPILLASESYFLLAEANLKGITGATADASDNFVKGIKASFNYLYELPSGTVSDGFNVDADYLLYKNDNATNYLVNFDLATTDDEKLEAIITQKYLAVNFINSQEGWNEYRRTGYPKIQYVAGTAGATSTFASLLSASTRADKLPSRILYPNSEYSYNSANVPSNITSFGEGIFWTK